MKLVRMLFLTTILSWTLSVYGAEKDSEPKEIAIEQMVEALKPRAYCRFVPEREDDFAFENNYIAMRFYGPALREKLEGAGCDCWTKRVEYPIVNKWYELSLAGHSHHIDRGEGWDGYKVGDSAGTGGTALWVDGGRVELDCFTEWKILENNPQRCSFVLTYDAEIDGSVYKEEKKITLPMDTRLYMAESTFWKGGKLAKGLPVCVGLTSHDGIGITAADIRSGWISCWEMMGDGYALGTGAAMPPEQIKSIEITKGNDEGKVNTGHILLIAETDNKGKITYAAGYAWQRAGDIVTQDKWHSYLADFCKAEYLK